MPPEANSTTDPTPDEDAQLDADFASAFSSSDAGAAGADPSAAGSAASADAAGAAVATAGRQPAADGAQPGEQPGTAPTVEQLQAELTRRRQAEQMLNGRLSASDRRLNELQQQLAQQRQEQLQAEQRRQQDLDETDDDTDPLKAAPDLARSIDKRVGKVVRDLEQKLADSAKHIEQLTQAVQSTRQQVQPLHETQHRHTIAQTHAGLDERFGTEWRSDVRTDAYAAWLEKQPPAIRDMAENAVGLDESAKVLHLFYAESGLKRQPSSAASPAASAAPAAPAPRAAASTQRNPQAAPAASRAVGLPSRPSLPQPAQDDEAALDAAFSAAFRG